MLHLTATGTTDPDARDFRIMRNDGNGWRYAGDFTLRLSEVPDLIAELTEWVDDTRS